MNVCRDSLHVVRDGGYLLRESECPLCGKRFSRTALHAWRLAFGSRPRYYCSYTCMRKAERERERKKAGKPNKSEEANTHDGLR